MADRIPAYSPDTDTEYSDWDALVRAESNGWVVVVIITQGTQVWPWVKGPYATRKDAAKAQSRLRRKWKKETDNRAKNQTAKFHVRPSWKADR